MEHSNFIWENKHTNTETNLVGNILDKARAYNPEKIEKYHIIVFNKEILYHSL